MFTVLYKPFPKSLNADPNAHVVLVRKAKGKLQILVQSLSVTQKNQEANSGQFEMAAAFLNTAPSKDDLMAMLESIELAWKHADTLRAYEQARRSSSQEHYRSCFGSLDASSPGQGGSGVDGYW